MMAILLNPIYKALRICKKGTKYCGWHREMPDFKQWRSACLVREGVFTYHNTHEGGLHISQH